MEEQRFHQVIRTAVDDADLISAEIPSIDLYLEQILSLVADKNQEGSAPADRTLTKNMINNYSKDGLITPVKGKKYSKEQIVQMLIVYSLKNTLSIDEIKRAMEGTYAKEEYSGAKLIAAYDRAMQIKQSQKEHCPAIVEQMLAKEGLDLGKDEDYFAALMAVASLSNYFRNIAKAMLEEYPVPESDEQKKAREKEEKRERKARKKAEATEQAEGKA